MPPKKKVILYWFVVGVFVCFFLKKMSFCKKFQSSTSSSAAKWQFKSDLRKKETDNGNAIV
jgi:hypothetical protein